jgi:hypothetical protein
VKAFAFEATSLTVITASWVPPAFCKAAILKGPCPLWVKSRHRRVQIQCPLYPRKRTSLMSRGTFASANLAVHA